MPSPTTKSAVANYCRRLQYSTRRGWGSHTLQTHRDPSRHVRAGHSHASEEASAHGHHQRTLLTRLVLACCAACVPRWRLAVLAPAPLGLSVRSPPSTAGASERSSAARRCLASSRTLGSVASSSNKHFRCPNGSPPRLRLLSYASLQAWAATQEQAVCHGAHGLKQHACAASEASGPAVPRQHAALCMPAQGFGVGLPPPPPPHTPPLARWAVRVHYAHVVQMQLTPRCMHVLAAPHSMKHKPHSLCQRCRLFGAAAAAAHVERLARLVVGDDAELLAMLYHGSNRLWAGLVHSALGSVCQPPHSQPVCQGLAQLQGQQGACMSQLVLCCTARASQRAHQVNHGATAALEQPHRSPAQPLAGRS